MYPTSRAHVAGSYWKLACSSIKANVSALINSLFFSRIFAALYLSVSYVGTTDTGDLTPTAPGPFLMILIIFLVPRNYSFSISFINCSKLKAGLTSVNSLSKLLLVTIPSYLSTPFILVLCPIHSFVIESSFIK